MSSTGVTPQAVAFGLMLRHFRDRAGFSQPHMAEQLGKRHPYWNRIENGSARLKEDDLANVALILALSASEQQQLRQQFREVGDENMLTPGVGKSLAVVAEYENRADDIFNNQPLLIPGPLQTREYAEAVMYGAGATPAQARDWVDYRMHRRATILGSGVRYTAIIGEYALRYPACGPDAAVGQRRQLVDDATLGDVTIQVLPFGSGYTPDRAGSFVLIRRTDQFSVVYTEHYRSSTLLIDAKDVRDYADATEVLRRAAMPPAESVEFIAALNDQIGMEQTA